SALHEEPFRMAMEAALRAKRIRGMHPELRRWRSLEHGFHRALRTAHLDHRRTGLLRDAAGRARQHLGAILGSSWHAGPDFRSRFARESHTGRGTGTGAAALPSFLLRPTATEPRAPPL